MVSLEVELTKRGITGKKYSLCLFCYNKMLLKYDKEVCIRRILEILDGRHTEIALLFDNIFDICIKQILFQNPMIIEQFIELLYNNLFIDTMDDVFMGSVGHKLKSNVIVPYDEIIITEYCSNPDDENTVKILDMLTKMTNDNLMILNEQYIDECLEYIARCNVYNEQPIVTDIVEMLNSYLEIRTHYKTHYHNEMLKLCELCRTIYNPTIDSCHSLFQHSFFCNSKLSINGRYMCSRKKYEDEHSRENMQKVKHVLIHEESRLVELEKNIQILKQGISSPTEEELLMFRKINVLLIEIMVSIKNELY